MSILDLSPREIHFDPPSRIRTIELVPTKYRHALLAAEMADALLILYQTSQLTSGRLVHYKSAVVGLIRWLDETSPDTHRLSISSEACADSLYDWESNLPRRYGPESSRPRALGILIRRLVTAHIASGNEVPDRVAAWAQSQPLQSSRPGRPLDEYTNEQRLALRTECRHRIRALERRLIVGDEWAMRIGTRTPMTSASRLSALHEVYKEASKPDFEAWRHRELNGQEMTPALRGAIESLTSQVDIARYFYPDRADLIAFRTLLQLQTGTAPEEWTSVTLMDISPSDSSVAIRIHKHRAHRIRTIHCPRSSGRPLTGWKSGDLVQRLLAVTQPSRDVLTPVEDDPTEGPLFCTVERTRHNTFDARLIQFERGEYRELCRATSPEVPPPYDARRLRKTVKSIRAAVLRSIDVAADDNTTPVFQQHYAQSTTLHVLAGEAITSAQSQVFARCQGGPTYVDRPAEDLISHPNKALARAAREVVDSTETDRSMGPAHCLAPFESPYAPPGAVCPQRPAMCFSCPNAIVFPDHLPRLLAYRDVLLSYAHEMPPTQFASTYGQQLTNLELVISKFTPEALEAARAELKRLVRAIHLPLAQRGTHQ